MLDRFKFAGKLANLIGLNTMGRISFPRWSGPILGALCGMLAALYTRFIGGDSLGFWPPVIGGTSLGAGCGFLVMLVDPAPVKKRKEEEVDPETLPNFAGNVLCAIGLIFFFMPFFSVFLSGFALHLNWKVKGWPRRLSWLGLLLGLMMTSLIVWHWFSQSGAS